MRSIQRLITATIFLFCALPGAVHAFSVSPLKFTVTVDPGKTQTVSVEVTNNESTAKQFRLTVQSLSMDEKGNKYFEAGKDPAESWVKTDSPTFELRPGESELVHFNITPLPGVPAGAHLLALMVVAENAEKQTIGISARAAIPLSLTVGGNVVENLAIAEWKPIKKVYFGKQVRFHAVLNNIGSANVGAAGNLNVLPYGSKLRVVRSVVFGTSIYPESRRQTDIDFDLPDFAWPGPQKAIIDVEYGLSHSHVQAITTVWYIPTYAVTGVAAALVLIIFVIVMWRRRGKIHG
jgi:hypothetical protein